jgi:hypothetical protein
VAAMSKKSQFNWVSKDKINLKKTMCRYLCMFAYIYRMSLHTSTYIYIYLHISTYIYIYHIYNYINILYI